MQGVSITVSSAVSLSFSLGVSPEVWQPSHGDGVQFEIYVHYENEAEASISQGVVTAKDGAVAGNTVRVSKGKRVGFACASGITTDRIKLSVQEALSIVDKIKVEDERFKGFLQPKGIGKEGAFHKDILSLGIDDLIKAMSK